MKANDFRIGNIVRYDGRIYTVDYLADGNVSLKGCNFEINAREVNPVQISEDILVKLGFNKTELENGHYYFLPLSYDKYIDLGLITQENKFRVVYLFPYEEAFDFKYIHEIQNLYFSITGKELKFTEI